MQEAINKATSMTLDSRQTFYRAISTSGIARSEAASPLFYYASFTVRPMYYDDYVTVQAGVSGDGNNGLTPYTITIPHNHVRARGTAWVAGVTVDGASQNGRTISLDNLQPGTIKALDYVQFAGSTKVYQVTTDVNVVGTQATITLNTPLVASPADSAAVTYGSDVQFNMLATGIPPVNTIPGHGGEPLWEFGGEFNLREVITP